MFMDTKSPFINIDNTSKNFNPKKHETYNLIIKNDNWIVKTAIDDIANKCNNDLVCAVFNIHDFLQTDILLDNKLKATYSPERTLKAKTANSIDKNLLASNLLSSLGVESYLLFLKRKDTPIPVFCNFDTIDIYSRLKKRAKENLLVEKSATLRKNQTWAVDNGENVEYKTVVANINVTATQKVDMRLFHSRYELDRHINNFNAIFASDCYADEATSINQNCIIPKGAILAFFSKGDNNIFNAKISKAGTLLSDVYPIFVNNKTCFVLDASITDNDIYPGYLKINAKNVKSIVEID